MQNRQPEIEGEWSRTVLFTDRCYAVTHVTQQTKASAVAEDQREDQGQKQGDHTCAKRAVTVVHCDTGPKQNRYFSLIAGGSGGKRSCLVSVVAQLKLALLLSRHTGRAV